MTLTVDGLGADGSLRDRRRRHVVADAEAPRRRHSPATWASGTPSGSTSTASPPGRHPLFVWFEPDLLPGYAWSFPLPDGRANVGFGIPATAARSSGCRT